MGRRFADIAFTPAVQALQTRYGSRAQYARTQSDEVPDDTLGPDEAEYLENADSLYLATVNSAGWPYAQHRGGPKGFLKAQRHTLAEVEAATEPLLNRIADLEAKLLAARARTQTEEP